MKLTFPISLFLAMCLCFVYGFWLGTKNPEVEVYDPNAMIKQAMVQRMPTIKQLQTELIRRGYDIGPKRADGNIGTLTKTAWDLCCNQQFADDSWPKGE